MTAARDLVRIKELLARDAAFDALPLVERAFAEDPDDPLVRSYYGLVTALERGQIRRSLELCREALAGAPESPELYLNLAHVECKAGNRAEAVRVLQNGIEQSGKHPQLIAALRGLGVRRPPIVSSLPRSHLLNRILGILAAKLGRR